MTFNGTPITELNNDILVGRASRIDRELGAIVLSPNTGAYLRAELDKQSRLTEERDAIRQELMRRNAELSRYPG